MFKLILVIITVVGYKGYVPTTTSHIVEHSFTSLKTCQEVRKNLEIAKWHKQAADEIDIKAVITESKCVKEK